MMHRWCRSVQLFDPDRVDADRCIHTTGYGLSAYTRGYSYSKPYGLMEFFCFDLTAKHSLTVPPIASPVVIG
jgi:hypothetical protein